MDTKLTLTIEQSVIEKAKVYAKQKGQSLSDMVENYLRSVTHSTGQEAGEMEASPLVRSLRGSFKSNSEGDDKEELTSILEKRYGLK
jgi:hypothetical protein